MLNVNMATKFICFLIVIANKNIMIRLKNIKKIKNQRLKILFAR